MACSEREDFTASIRKEISDLSIRSLKNLIALRGHTCKECKDKNSLAIRALQVCNPVVRMPSSLTALCCEWWEAGRDQVLAMGDVVVVFIGLVVAHLPHKSRSPVRAETQTLIDTCQTLNRWLTCRPRARCSLFCTLQTP